MYFLPIRMYKRDTLLCQAVAELYSKRKWLGQATGEAALLVTSKAFQGEGEFARTALPLLVPLLKGKDGSNLQVKFIAFFLYYCSDVALDYVCTRYVVVVK